MSLARILPLMVLHPMSRGKVGGSSRAALRLCVRASVRPCVRASGHLCICAPVRLCLCDKTGGKLERAHGNDLALTQSPSLHPMAMASKFPSPRVLKLAPFHAHKSYTALAYSLLFLLIVPSSPSPVQIQPRRPASAPSVTVPLSHPH